MTNSADTLSRSSLSPEERVARDRRIAAARSAGDSWAVIAEREGVSEKTARRAVERIEKAGVSVGVELPDVLPDPRTLLGEVAATQYATMREAFRRVGLADNDSAAVGAMRTALSAGTALQMTLMRAGLVRSPGMEWFRYELGVAVRVLFDIAEETGVPVDVLMARFEREVPRRGLEMSEIVEGVAS